MSSDEQILRDAFKAFDGDGSGSVDLKELREVVKVYFELMQEQFDDKKVTALAEVCSNSLAHGPNRPNAGAHRYRGFIIMKKTNYSIGLEVCVCTII